MENAGIRNLKLTQHLAAFPAMSEQNDESTAGLTRGKHGVGDLVGMAVFAVKIAVGDGRDVVVGDVVGWRCAGRRQILYNKVGVARPL